jgi:hypothetical protein
MRELSKLEQDAVEAVARHFSGTWEKGDESPDAYVSIAGKRTAREVTTFKQRSSERDGLTKPRLRFDKVALGLVRGLQAALREVVPNGNTVILTVTAPIRLPSKTAAQLEDKIRSCLSPQLQQVEIRDTIHGNQVRIRLVMGGSRETSKVIGFVHNPDPDPQILLDVAQSLLECMSAAADRGAPTRFAGDRWLVVINEGELSHIETYRHVYSQLSIPTGFTKILMVSAGGKVEALT